MPPTLSLTLGAPASFGAFTPGVDRDYTASTTATVTSTAGDARLGVDGGRLANGAFALPSPVAGRTLEVGVDRAGVQRERRDRLHAAHRRHGPAADRASTQTLTFSLSTTAP